MSENINKATVTMKSSLLSGIVAVSEEVAAHDMDTGSSNSFINDNGIFKSTIEKAFLFKTKSKGVGCTILFRGENSIDITLYIVSNKKGKLVTTYVSQGKTISLNDYKLFKQLYAVVTGEVKPMEEIDVIPEVIKYKVFGKDVKVDGETIVELIGKEVEIGIRLEESFAWDNEEKCEDKTELKTDKNGDVVYKKSLDSVFSKDGFSAEEVITEATEAKDIESKRKFLEGDKATKRVKLEDKVEEESEEDTGADVEEELNF